MILFMSNSGECLPLAYRMGKEGTDAAVYMHSPRYRSNYDGLVPKLGLAQLKGALKKADLVIFDITRPNHKTKEDLALLKMFGVKTSSRSVFGPVADKIKRDTQVIGCSEWSEDVELDREAGMKVAKDIGLQLSEYKNFNTLKDGVKFLEGRSDLWVLKPHDNADLDLTYVEKWAGELLNFMKWVLPDRVGESFKYLLQRKVEGVEISTEGWWDGFRYTNFNHTIEDKSLLTGNQGVSVGSMNNVVWVKRNQGLLVNELNRLAPYLKRAGYVGPVDVNAIVSQEDHKPYFLEFTARCGYDALYCLLSLVQQRVTDYFTTLFKVTFDPGFVASVRYSVPPYPYNDPELLDRLAKGVYINHSPARTPDIWWEDVKLDAKGNFICAGSDGILAVVTGTGKSIGEATGKVYEQAKKIKISSKPQYRTDLGRRAEKAVGSLTRWGWDIR